MHRGALSRGAVPGGVLLVLFMVGMATTVRASSEFVSVVKVLDDDKVIVERRGGDRDILEKGVGCLSIWRFEGRAILVTSPGMFAGVGAKIVLDDVDQECRVWSSELLSGGGAAAPASAAPSAQPHVLPRELLVMATQRALQTLGFDAGPIDGVPGARTAAALARFCAQRGLSANPESTALALLQLAQEMGRFPNDQGATTAAAVIREALLDGAATVRADPRASEADCDDGHWVASVSSDGQIVKLEDGSIWEVNAVDRIDTMLWLPVSDITICGNRMINTDDGETVAVQRLR